MKKYLAILCLSLGLAALFSGCLPLRPAKDNTKFFVLTPHSWSSEKPSYPTKLNVAVVRTEFSDYLDNSQIATRPSREQIDYNPWMRWAEPLSSGLTRTLVTNLTLVMDNQLIQAYPNRVPGYKPDVLVFVHIVRFDGILGGPCALVVRWRITSADGKQIFFAEDKFFTQKSGASYLEYVATLSSLWNTFADHVAANISQLEKDKKIVISRMLD